MGYVASDWVPWETMCIIAKKRSHQISRKETTRRVQTVRPPGETKAGPALNSREQPGGMPDAHLDSDFKRKGHEGQSWENSRNSSVDFFLGNNIASVTNCHGYDQDVIVTRGCWRLCPFFLRKMQ